MKQANPYPLRLEESLSKKIKFLANENNRSFNKEVEWVLKKYIEKYENDNGSILIETSE